MSPRRGPIVYRHSSKSTRMLAYCSRGCEQFDVAEHRRFIVAGLLFKKVLVFPGKKASFRQRNLVTGAFEDLKIFTKICTAKYDEKCFLII